MLLQIWKNVVDYCQEREMEDNLTQIQTRNHETVIGDFGTKIYQMKNICTNIFGRGIQFSVSGTDVNSRLMKYPIHLLNST